MMHQSFNCFPKFRFTCVLGSAALFVHLEGFGVSCQISAAFCMKISGGFLHSTFSEPHFTHQLRLKDQNQYVRNRPGVL